MFIYYDIKNLKKDTPYLLFNDGLLPQRKNMKTTPLPHHAKLWREIIYKLVCAKLRDDQSCQTAGKNNHVRRFHFSIKRGRLLLI
jgi:hypothetical protein